MEQWASGRFTDLSQYGTAILNAKAIGAIEAFAVLEDLSYEKIIEGELEDVPNEELQRFDAVGCSSPGGTI